MIAQPWGIFRGPKTLHDNTVLQDKIDKDSLHLEASQ